MREEVSHGRRPKVRLRWDEPEGAKVVVCRRVEVQQPLLPQLHHRDCGEGLGDRSDAKDGVFGDRRLRCNIGEAVPVEPDDVSVSDHGDRQSGARPAVEDLSDRRLRSRSSIQPYRACVLGLVGSGGGQLIVCPLVLLTEYLDQLLPGIDRGDDAEPVLEAAAASRHRSSRYRGPITCTACGRPSAMPTGSATAGSPSALTAMAIRMVREVFGHPTFVQIGPRLAGDVGGDRGDDQRMVFLELAPRSQ